MASPFDALASQTIDICFETFGATDATYSNGAAPTACRVIQNSADDQANIGSDFRAVGAQCVIDVRSSQVAAPMKGGVFTIGASSFRIVAAPRRTDPNRLIWSCLCDPL